MFDISKLDVVAMQSQGAWMHIVDIQTGALTYADKDKQKPLRIKLKGASSKEGKRMNIEVRNIERRIKEAEDKDDFDKVELLEVERLNVMVKNMAKLTIEWENLYEKGSELKFSQEEAERIYRGHEGLLGQCLLFFMNPRNYCEK